MNDVTQLAAVVLVVGAICLPSVGFILWLVLQWKKKRGLGLPFTRRVRSALVSVLSALGACVVAAGVSRAFEISSSSRLLVTTSMISAYAFYAFVALNLIALVSLLLLWGISSFQKEPSQPTEPTAKAAAHQ